MTSPLSVADAVGLSVAASVAGSLGGAAWATGTGPPVRETARTAASMVSAEKTPPSNTPSLLIELTGSLLRASTVRAGDKANGGRTSGIRPPTGWITTSFRRQISP